MPATPQIGSGQSVTQFELVLPHGNRKTLLAGPIAHESSSLRETLFGPCEYVHRLQVLNTAFFEQDIRQAMSEGTPRLRFRHGLGGPGNVFWLPWQSHIIMQPKALLRSLDTNAGHIIEISTQDQMWLLLRGSRIFSHKGLISDMVTNIADVSGPFDAVVEKTVGIGTYIQGYGGLAEFIQTRLLPRALNEKGRGNFLFYFRDNVLHFHSPDYQAEVHTVVYERDGGEALTHVDNSQTLIDEGVDTTLVVVYNPLTGQTRLLHNEPDKALRLADSLYNLNFPFSQKIINYHQSANRQEELQAICQRTYEAARIQTYQLYLHIEKTIHIRPGDFINLILIPNSRKASSWAGLYLVSEVRHAIQSGSVHSVYTLTRGEIQKSLDTLTTAVSPDLLINEQRAPGQDLNIPEAKSSARTKGAGQVAVNGRLYSTILDPNSSPMGNSSPPE